MANCEQKGRTAVDSGHLGQVSDRATCVREVRCFRAGMAFCFLGAGALHSDGWVCLCTIVSATWMAMGEERVRDGSARVG